MKVVYHGTRVPIRASRVIMPDQLVGCDKKLFANGEDRWPGGRPDVGHPASGWDDSAMLPMDGLIDGQVSRGQLIVTICGIFNLKEEDIMAGSGQSSRLHGIVHSRWLSTAAQQR
jgi:hypothetical protein